MKLYMWPLCQYWGCIFLTWTEVQHKTPTQFKLVLTGTKKKQKLGLYRIFYSYSIRHRIVDQMHYSYSAK